MIVEQGSCRVVCVGFDEPEGLPIQYWIMVEHPDLTLSTVFTDSDYDGYDTGDRYPE